jgi:hypothetical protein
MDKCVVLSLSLVQEEGARIVTCRRNKIFDVVTFHISQNVLLNFEVRYPRSVDQS